MEIHFIGGVCYNVSKSVFDLLVKTWILRVCFTRVSCSKCVICVVDGAIGSLCKNVKKRTLVWSISECTTVTGLCDYILVEPNSHSSLVRNQQRNVNPLMVDDRISTLPDEIICHILSFLPTEDVFTTKLLSKRWTPLWLLLSNLDFDDRRCSHKPYSCFLNMVYVAIYARSLRNPIKKFCLRCDGNSISEPKESDVVTWLTAAAERGMEHLDVHISSNQNFNCVFSFKNLLVLKLRAIRISTILPVDLPLLRALHLNGVYLCEHWFLLEILNGCPILEDFEAKNTFVRNSANEYEAEFKRLTKLVKADLSNLSVFNVSLEAFSNVEFLRLEEIYGCVPVFSNLTHLELVSRRTVNWCLLYDMLEKCPKLQNLLLEMPQLVTSVSSLFWYPNIFPKCLSSQLKECTIANYRGSQYELNFLQHIMLNSTSLQRITISSPPSMNPREMLEMQKELSFFPMSSPTCELIFKFV